MSGNISHFDSVGCNHPLCAVLFERMMGYVCTIVVSSVLSLTRVTNVITAASGELWV